VLEPPPADVLAVGDLAEQDGELGEPLAVFARVLAEEARPELDGLAVVLG